VTKRGVNGGYILARPPGRITIGDIVRSLEGPIALCDCLQNTGSKQANERMKQCVTSEIYQRLSVMVESAFDSFTLDDLMKIHVESPAVGTCATLTGN